MFYDNGFRGHFRRYPAAGDTGKSTLFIAVGVQDPDQKVYHSGEAVHGVSLEVYHG